VGIEMEIPLYIDLKQKFEHTVRACMVDLLDRLFLPHVVVELAIMARVSLFYFLTEREALSKKYESNVLKEKFRELIDEGAITQSIYEKLGREFRRAKWKTWDVALMSCADRVEQVTARKRNAQDI
jgi:hypothetical protein